MESVLLLLYLFYMLLQQLGRPALLSIADISPQETLCMKQTIFSTHIMLYICSVVQALIYLNTFVKSILLSPFYKWENGDTKGCPKLHRKSVAGSEIELSRSCSTILNPNLQIMQPVMQRIIDLIKMLLFVLAYVKPY